MSVRSNPSSLLGFKDTSSSSYNPTGGIGGAYLDLLKNQPAPYLGELEHEKMMKMLRNAYTPKSLATFLFGFE